MALASALLLCLPPPAASGRRGSHDGKQAAPGRTPAPLPTIRARRGVIFFFCGCKPCQEAGRLWAPIQRGGEFDDPPARPVSAAVVFLGDAKAAKSFAAEVGLDPARIALRPDPASRLALQWKAMPCPRAFVFDSHGRLRYTNDRKDDAPRKSPPAVMVARVVDALRAAAKADRNRGAGSNAASGKAARP